MLPLTAINGLALLAFTSVPVAPWLFVADALFILPLAFVLLVDPDAPIVEPVVALVPVDPDVPIEEPVDPDVLPMLAEPVEAVVPEPLVPLVRDVLFIVEEPADPVLPVVPEPLVVLPEAPAVKASVEAFAESIIAAILAW